MALWTPYYTEEVMDLRKSVIIKPESISPPELSPHSTTPAITPMYPNDCDMYRADSTSPSSTTSSCCTSTVDILRPFKMVTSDLGDPEYALYRDSMFEAVRLRNGGSLTVSNPRMRRAVRPSSAESSDPGYQERRARNNAAAKRSRDLRKQKEDELAIRVAYLERQNAELRARLAAPTQCTRCNVTF